MNAFRGLLYSARAWNGQRFGVRFMADKYLKQIHPARVNSYTSTRHAMTIYNDNWPNQPGENPSPQPPNPEVGQPPADPTPTHAPTEAPNSAPQEVPQTRPGEGAGQQTEHPSAPQ